MIDFNHFRWISFDGYGTLVDWETGISQAVASVLESRGIHKTPSEILGLFADVESKAQTSGEFLDYRRVLRMVMEAMASEIGLELSGAEPDCLADSLPHCRSSQMLQAR